MPLAILRIVILTYGIRRGPMVVGFSQISANAFCQITGYSGTGIPLSNGALAGLMAFAMQKMPRDLFSDICPQS